MPDLLADLLDVIVINLKEAGRQEELSHGALYLKIQKMLANYNRWVFEHKKPEGVKTLREWIIQETEFQTVAAEILCGVAGKHREGGRTFFGQTNHQERARWTVSTARRIIHCGVVRRLRIWISAVVGIQLNSLEFASVVYEEITQVTNAPGANLVVLMAFKEHTIFCCMEIRWQEMMVPEMEQIESQEQCVQREGEI